MERMQAQQYSASSAQDTHCCNRLFRCISSLICKIVPVFQEWSLQLPDPAPQRPSEMEAFSVNERLIKAPFLLFILVFHCVAVCRASEPQGGSHCYLRLDVLIAGAN